MNNFAINIEVSYISIDGQMNNIATDCQMDHISIDGQGGLRPVRQREIHLNTPDQRPSGRQPWP